MLFPPLRGNYQLRPKQTINTDSKLVLDSSQWPPRSFPPLPFRTQLQFRKNRDSYSLFSSTCLLLQGVIRNLPFFQCLPHSFQKTGGTASLRFRHSRSFGYNHPPWSGCSSFLQPRIPASTRGPDTLSSSTRFMDETRNGV